MIEPEIASAQEKVDTLFNSPFKDLKDLQSKSGVYLIYEKDKIIYCGKSKNLKRRIMNQHISASKDGKSSIFRKKLKGYYKVTYGYEMREWVIENCRFKIIYEDNPDLRNLIEALSIIQARKSSGDLLLNES